MLAIIAAIENDFEREFITQIYLTYYKKMKGNGLNYVRNYKYLCGIKRRKGIVK